MEIYDKKCKTSKYKNYQIKESARIPLAAGKQKTNVSRLCIIFYKFDPSDTTQSQCIQSSYHIQKIV